MLMLAFIYSIQIIEETPWWNYPGFELWRIVNLSIFILAVLYLHHRFGRPVSEALRSRRERIKQELETARTERDLALKKLAEVEIRLKGLDSEVSVIRAQATAEAEAEKQRIKLATEVELDKLRQNAQREIDSTAKAAKQELREFAAKQSVLLAENAIRKEIRPEDDARLIGINVEQLGRNSH